DATSNHRQNEPFAATLADASVAIEQLRLLTAQSEDANERGDASSLWVHARGEWFRPPGSDRVDCRARRVVRVLLVALAVARRDRPGVPVSCEELQRLGWPNEKMHPDSARNRIKQSMAVLRRLGLGRILARGEG